MRGGLYGKTEPSVLNYVYWNLEINQHCKLFYNRRSENDFKTKSSLANKFES